MRNEVPMAVENYKWHSVRVIWHSATHEPSDACVRGIVYRFNAYN